jgi:hypothetical protein
MVVALEQKLSKLIRTQNAFTIIAFFAIICASRDKKQQEKPNLNKNIMKYKTGC